MVRAALIMSLISFGGSTGALAEPMPFDVPAVRQVLRTELRACTPLTPEPQAPDWYRGEWRANALPEVPPLVGLAYPAAPSYWDSRVATVVAVAADTPRADESLSLRLPMLQACVVTVSRAAVALGGRSYRLVVGPRGRISAVLGGVPDAIDGCFRRVLGRMALPRLAGKSFGVALEVDLR